jgi:hypothetical protein
VGVLVGVRVGVGVRVAVFVGVGVGSETVIGCEVRMYLLLLSSVSETSPSASITTTR